MTSGRSKLGVIHAHFRYCRGGARSIIPVNSSMATELRCMSKLLTLGFPRWTAAKSKAWLPSITAISSPRATATVDQGAFHIGTVRCYCGKTRDSSAVTDSETPESEQSDNDSNTRTFEKTLTPKEWQEITRGYSQPPSDRKLTLPSQLESAEGALQDFDLEELLSSVQKARLGEGREEDVTPKMEKVQRSTPMSISELVEFLQEENAQDICVISVPPEREYVNYLVTCTGTGTRHIGRMADSLTWELKAIRLTAKRKGRVVVEGRDCDDWMAVDLGTMVVHFMTEEARERYELEKLWTLGHCYDDQYQSTKRMLEEQQW